MTARTATLLAAFAVLAAGRPDADAAIRPEYGGTARFAISEPLATLDPRLAASVTEDFASRCVFETLTGASGLARSAESFEGDARWRFGIEPGIAFHDGSPCDAEAVRASLAAALALAGLTADAPRALADTMTARVSAVESLSESVVEIRLTAPADLARRLADPRLAIVSRAGSGTGPFRAGTILPSPAPGAVVLRLTAFDAYRGGRPFLDAIEFVGALGAGEELRLFSEGRADLIAAPAPPAPAHSVIAAPESALIVARLPEPLPVFAGVLARAIRPAAMLRFLPEGYAVARTLKPSLETSDEEKVPAGASCAVGAPAGNPALARVAERVQVDLLDAGIEARLVAFGTAGALAIVETCGDEPPAGSVALLSHARRYAVSASLVNVGARGCGPDLDSAWRRH